MVEERWDPAVNLAVDDILNDEPLGAKEPHGALEVSAPVGQDLRLQHRGPPLKPTLAVRVDPEPLEGLEDVLVRVSLDQRPQLLVEEDIGLELADAPSHSCPTAAYSCNLR